MSFHDLRAFLSRLDTAGQLRRVDAPVSPHLESTALSLRALRAGGPALLMAPTPESPHRYLGNLFGHRSRVFAGLRGGEASAGIRRLCRNWQRGQHRHGGGDEQRREVYFHQEGGPGHDKPDNPRPTVTGR